MSYFGETSSELNSEKERPYGIGFYYEKLELMERVIHGITDEYGNLKGYGNIITYDHMTKQFDDFEGKFGKNLKPLLGIWIAGDETISEIIFPETKIKF